jgi:hypothetical protein
VRWPGRVGLADHHDTERLDDHHDTERLDEEPGGDDHGRDHVEH